VTGAAAAGLHPSSLLQVPRHRRRLHGELERVVLVRRYRHGHGSFRLELLRTRVEVLAERHQVQPVLTQRRPHWRRRPSPAGGNREPDRRRHCLRGAHRGMWWWLGFFRK